MRKAIGIAMMAGALAAQAGTPAFSPPPLAPAFTNHISGAATAEMPHSWWQSFNDPVLNQLIEHALNQNIDLKIAQARIEAAEALRRTVKANGRPELDLALAGGRERLSGYTLGFPKPSTESQFSSALEVSWEIDLFGRIRNDVRAAGAEASAASDDARAARIAVLLRVTRAYLTIRGLERLLDIAQSNQRAQEQTALYTRRLVSAGALPVGDQYRADAQAATTAAATPLLELKREERVEELAALLAITPEATHAALNAGPVAPPDLAPLPGTGVPADLMRLRPDVRAAESRVRAAMNRVGVAEADLKPRFELSGLIGTLVDSFSGPSFSRSINWLAAASGAAPLIDGGRRRSLVAERQAEAKAAVLTYQYAVLTAVLEVETSLASIARDRERSASLALAASDATKAADQIRQAWTAGESPILDVLEADRVRFAAEAALADSQASEQLDRATLFAALGGSKGADE
jgi:multidrug efflux system outer membrane protein